MEEKSKKQKLLEKIQEFGQFRCPKCDGRFNINEGSLQCENGHTFDVNKKGFVNLALKQSETYYDETLFAARARVFEGGFYAPVMEAIGGVLAGTQAVLDAGCGEGYYLQGLCAPFGVGVDLSREAIGRAARERQNGIWCVADLAKLPFQDACFDGIMDILSPANYTAFMRVLKPGGQLVKVIPGGEYLKEIRMALGQKEYDETRVLRYMEKTLGQARVVPVKHVYKITKEIWRDFIYMTPLTKDLAIEERESLADKNPGHITIDLNMAITVKAKEISK